MSYWLGIDVGTTFTAAAVCRAESGRRGLPEVVGLGTRSSVVSSVVYLGADGQVVVGDAAQRRALTDPERVVREFKRRIGDDVPMVIGGLPYSAPEITAKVLRWVIEQVAHREGGPATAIVVTHPAGWGSYKITTMAAAVRAAGLPQITWCTEPEAAAASYARTERIDPGATIAVYDLGGGTFDTAVVRKTGAQTFTTLGAPQGLDQLGGADFDDLVFSHVLTAVPALAQLNPHDPATLAATAALRRECTEAKEALSADTDVTIPVLAPGIHTQVRLIRAEFEDLIRPHITDTIHALRHALRHADVDPTDLDAILLVGGSSRIPLIAQLLSTELGRPIATDTDPQTAIALGAALSALPPAVTDPGDVAPCPNRDLPVSVAMQAPPRPALTAIPLDVEPAELHWHGARTRLVKRVAVAGAFSLLAAAGVVSVPFLTSQSGPLPQAAAGTPTPSVPPAPDALGGRTVGAPSGGGPAANAATSSDSSPSGVAVRTARPTAPNKPVGGVAKPDPAAVAPSAPPPTWVTTYTWTSPWSSPPPTTASSPPPPPPPPDPPTTTTKESPLPTPAPTPTTVPTATASRRHEPPR